MRERRFRVRMVIWIALAVAIWGSAAAEASPPRPSALAENVRPGPPAPQSARFEHVTTADGLSFPIVQDILQDQQGYLWFATYSGLNRYDGYEFTVYRHDPGDPTSLRSDYVAAIFEDRDGTLWVGGGGGLDRFDPRSETFVHVDTRGQVFAICEDSAGTLWVGFWHGLYGYDRATNEMIISSQPDPNAPQAWEQRTQSSVIALQVDDEGALWVGTSRGLYRRDGTTGTFTRYRYDPANPASLSSDAISVIYEDSQGGLWVGTEEGGLNRFNPRSRAFDRFQHDPEDPTTLSHDTVISILEDSAGTLWVGTLDGLNRMGRNGAGFEQYQHDPDDPQSLPDNSIPSLFEDRSGVLWVGTANGLSKDNRRGRQVLRYRQQADPLPVGSYEVDVSKLLQEPEPAILSDGRVLTLHEDEDGVLWMGTLNGGLNRLDPASGLLTVYRNDPGDPRSLRSDTISALLRDRAGVLWVGTGNGWLERFDPTMEGFVHHRHLGQERVTSLAEDGVGNLWIGTIGEGLYCLGSDRMRLKHFEAEWRDPDHWWREGSLSSHIITSLYVDRAGMLWGGTYYGGINLWNEEEDRFTHLRHDPANTRSLSHDIVLSFWEDPATEDVWVGTEGGGLNRFDRASQTFTRFADEGGMTGDIVGCILGDESGFLWLGTVKGLSRLDPYSGTFRSYDRRDGVSALSAGFGFVGDCLLSRTGEMVFGGMGGVYLIDPAQDQEIQRIPAVAITSVRVANQTMRRYLPPGEEIWLAYDDNFLSFEFAALDYILPEGNQYAYMLEGLDRDWVYVGTRRYADYPDLRPGKYIFRVRGSNSDGVWNEEGVAVRITVEPPFWDLWVFRGGMLLILVLGGLGVYRQRVRSIEARSRALEREVRERTYEIERRRRVAEALREILAVLNSDRPLNEVLAYIVAQAGRLLGADAALLHELVAGRPYVAILASAGLPDELAHVEAIPYEASWADEAILTRQPTPVADLANIAEEAGGTGDPVAQQWLEAVYRRYRSFLAVPLRVEGEVDHCLAFYYAEPQAFGSEDLSLALALADQAALAIENARLYEHAQDLAAMQERQRLARDLHDAVSQTLFSASLIAETVPDVWQACPDEGADLVHKLRQLTQGALAEMRALLMELRPAALLDASMQDLLGQLGRAVTGREGIPVDVSAEECDLPGEVRVALYRIAQEALNNVVKHARANRVVVRLRCLPVGPTSRQSEPRGIRIEMTIRDDGCGFDPKRASAERLGLGIMQERSAAIGAHLQVDSAPGQGTQVRVVWAEAGDTPQIADDG